MEVDADGLTGEGQEEEDDELQTLAEMLQGTGEVSGDDK
jgi:hypothetical protein